MLIRAIPVSILLLLSIASPAPAAQQPTTGTIRGIVTDQQDAVIAGAQVTATHTDSNRLFKTESGSDGTFVLPGLPFGSYQVTISVIGFNDHQYNLSLSPSAAD